MPDDLRTKIARKLYDYSTGTIDEFDNACSQTRQKYERMAVVALTVVSEEAVEEETMQSSGWSSTVGELRAAMEEFEDDVEVVLTNAEADDCEIAALDIDSRFPSTDESPGLLVLQGGQTISTEYDFGTRLDAHLAAPTQRVWNNATHRWYDQ